MSHLMEVTFTFFQTGKTLNQSYMLNTAHKSFDITQKQLLYAIKPLLYAFYVAHKNFDITFNITQFIF